MACHSCLTEDAQSERAHSLQVDSCRGTSVEGEGSTYIIYLKIRFPPQVLIYDKNGSDIISPLLTVKELRSLGVTLHL